MYLLDKNYPYIQLLSQVHDSIIGQFKHNTQTQYGIHTKAEAKNAMIKVMTKDVITFMKKFFDFEFNVPLESNVKISRVWEG